MRTTRALPSLYGIGRHKMSQHHLKDSEGREWMIGYNNPCGGFFATRWALDQSGAEEDEARADVLIGFGKGVDLETLDEECRKHGLELDEKMLVELYHDESLELRPLSPLQQNVRKMFAEFGFFD
jgi:hypothetical protein